MNDDHERRADMAAHEYWTRIHSGEIREGLLPRVAWRYGVTDQELRTAIGRYTLRKSAGEPPDHLSA